MYACSPTWPADWITESDLEHLLSQLAGSIQSSPWGPDRMSLNHGLHFTGGEPFLNYDLLLTATEMAERLQVPSTFVETNGFWAADDAATEAKLRQLKEAGLKGMMISVNPFYAEYVPFERTERCVRISREVFGPNVMVYQDAYYRLFRRLGLETRISYEDYRARTQQMHGERRVELFLMGRAARALGPHYPSRPAEHYFNEPCRPAFLRDWHNHFDNYGNFMPGYCGGISLGDWHELGTLTSVGVNMETHPVLFYLLAEDVEGLLYFARERGYETAPGGYVSKCDLCLDIRAYLAKTGEFKELTPRRFYDQLPPRATA
jgi:hypothetical protein